MSSITFNSDPFGNQNNYENKVGVEGVQAIAPLAGHTKLELHGNGIGNQGVNIVAGSLKSLTRLDLAGSHIDDMVARSIDQLNHQIELQQFNNAIDDIARWVAKTGQKKK